MKEMSRKVIGWILFLLWLYFIMYLTIIHRKQGETASYNLHLFWCIKDAWRSRNPVNWYFVIANIGVFIPLGMILPICCISWKYKKVKKMLAIPCKVVYTSKCCDIDSVEA